ncbi:MAG: hypothetical protein BAA03_12010 [Caldibacillus debilis]|nr:MAG: hypothetical protein BAA03_12010 [Caldibacillus debilis]
MSSQPGLQPSAAFCRGKNMGKIPRTCRGGHGAGSRQEPQKSRGKTINGDVSCIAQSKRLTK